MSFYKPSAILTFLYCFDLNQKKWSLRKIKSKSKVNWKSSENNKIKSSGTYKLKFSLRPCKNRVERGKRMLLIRESISTHCG